MYTRSIAHLRVEGTITVNRASPGDECLSNDRTVLAVESEGDGTSASARCGDAEAGGSPAEVHTTEFDQFTVVDVEDIHILLSRRRRHVCHDTRVGDAHLG